MSRNQRRRQTHAKRKKIVNKSKYKRQNSLNLRNRLSKITFSSIQNNISSKLSKVKSNIFKKRDIKQLFISFVDDIKSYTDKNKKSVIFSVSLFAICFVAYFAVVYESDENKANRIFNSNQQTVSINLSEQNDEEEIKAISEPVANVQIVSEEQQASIEAAKVKEQTAAIESITADIITKEAVSLAVNAIAENRNYNPVSESIKLGIDMYAIKVDGKEVAYLQHKTEAEGVVDTLKEKYRLEDAVEDKIVFREDVKVAKVKRDIFDFEGFQTQEQVLEYIEKGTNEQRIHKVEPGESFSYIEQIYSLPWGSLEEANPDIKPSRLQIGQEISLIVAEPIINVVSISTVERIDAISYGKEPNVKTDKYFVGEYFTKRSGVLGEAEVVVEVYKENGKVIGEKVLESTTLVEPINKIVYQGTKPAPPKIGTGTFQRPTSRGYITSGFGARWGSFHNGIDIGLPMRSNVYAADGGVVIYSGWKGTFGKLVIIDHGANMLSYYAHNDQLLVGAGEKVFKGQVITYSGNTGRSTGPHLHFEVRKNNRPVNPRNYVSY